MHSIEAQASHQEGLEGLEGLVSCTLAEPLLRVNRLGGRIGMG